jgi:hypothetical protein
VIGGSALAVDLLAFLAIAGSGSSPDAVPKAMDRGRRATTFAAASLPVLLVGLHLHESSYPDELFWQRTLARMKVSETTREEVRACLHAPSATSSSGAEETWTYFTTRPGAWRSGRSVRTVSLTFKDGVLAEVRRSEVNLRPGDAWPVTEPVPVVIPVPPSLEAGTPPPR